MRRTFGFVRLLAAAAGLVALLGDFDYVLGFSTFSTSNYFSYFTFQSNLANAATLAASGIMLLRGRTASTLLVSLRAMIIAYVCVSGIVFAIIVSQSASHNYRIDVPWSSQVLHFWMPAYVILDWLVGVGRVRLRWRTVPLALAFPILWGVITLIRGSVVRWYPYFFLDPAQVSGPLESVGYLALALALFALIMTTLVAISRLSPKGSESREGRQAKRRQKAQAS